MKNLNKEVIIYLERKNLLNSNSMPSHIMVKSKIASNLRDIAAELGVKEHTSPILAQERLDLINQEAIKTLAKSRTRKRMNKKGESEEAILEEIAKIDALNIDNKLSSEVKVPYLFDRFKVTITVCPPTRRRFDPPNLYPTVKHLIDGFTDASWWEDDQFTNLLEMSFRYGGLSDDKEKFKLILNFSEIEESDISSYITIAEISQGEVNEQ